jgi:hypothetical protein
MQPVKQFSRVMAQILQLTAFHSVVMQIRVLCSRGNTYRFENYIERTSLPPTQTIEMVLTSVHSLPLRFERSSPTSSEGSDKRSSPDRVI